MSYLDHLVPAGTSVEETSTVPHKVESSAGAQTHGAFRPDIQGLRAIAILLVVGYHIGFPGLRGGFIGVDVFFVLSGYLITGILVKEIRKTGKINLGRFYARRARRLLPAAVLTIIATVAVSSLLSPIEQLSTSKTAVATAAYVSNVWFMFKAADYFAPENETNPLMHTWSLGVEEQFYLVWPLIVLIGYAGFRRNNSTRRLVLLMATMLAISFGACVWLSRTHQPWAFFSSPTRAWEFALGGLASLVTRTSKSWKWSVVAWGGLTLILGGAAIISDKTLFPGAAAAVPALGTAMVLIAGVSSYSWVQRVLEVQVFQKIGEVSYSWYLWHWPIFATAIALWPRIPLWGRILCALTSLGLAGLTYLIVENPIRYNQFFGKRTRLSLAFAGALTIVAVAVAAGSARLASDFMRASPQKEFAQAAQDNTGAATSGCINNFLDSRPHECIFGDVNSKHAVVLFGDSHAAQWFPAVEQIAKQRDWKLVTFLKSSCPAASVHVFNPRLRRIEAECDAWREGAMQKIVAIHPDLVLIANATGYIRGGAHADGYAQLSLDQWKAGVHDVLARLDGSGVATVLLRDTPRPGFSVPICLARAARHAWYSPQNCALDRNVVLDNHGQQTENDAASGLRHAAFIDLTDLFCNSRTCENQQNNVVVFKDSNHLTVRFAKAMAPELAQRLNNQLLTRLEYPNSGRHY